MREEQKRELPGTSREAEEQHLKETLTVVRENVEKYGAEVSGLRSSIDDMLNHFHDDNPELINELENADTMYRFLKKTLERNEKALKKPYFGRIDFHDKTLDRQETFYIGRSGISRDVIHPIVVDWRSPVANTYYENGLGKCSYFSPEGKELSIDLKLKRTYEIENGELQSIFDTEVIANDDILTKYLSKNKQAVLGEIVATIQKEQNEIIRRSPYHNCLVQGVAGSGKTTVAMHRISYILYNYEKKFRPEDFYIVGSNRILLNYITGVLPDLDVYGVRQMTMEQLFVRLLYEDWDEKKYRIKGLDAAGSRNLRKGKLDWFRELEAFCERLEQRSISRESIYLNPRQFVEGFFDGKAGVHDRTGGKPGNPKELVLLMEGRAVEQYIRENPTISIQSKIDMLNERLRIKIKDEFLGKGVRYTEAERREILKFYRGRYGARTWKKSIFELYGEFLAEQKEKGQEVDAPEDAFDVYDLAALAYLYKRVKETEVISEAHHVVIDEAQDFGMMAYSVLKFCMKDCTYTIMGDVSQNIHFGTGLNDWEELKELYLQTDRSSFGILKKSYRNTVEISNFATEILYHGNFAVYPVEPIIRHGKAPTVATVKDGEEFWNQAAAVCREWQDKGLETIAVVCRNAVTARETAKLLGKHIVILESDLENAEFGKGILVLPVEYTKGLEFDAVLILDPTREEYPVDDGHAKLLYVAATRALHELCVLHRGNLTGLIADPVPKRERRVLDEGAEDPKAGGQESDKRSVPETIVARNRKMVETAVDRKQKAPETAMARNRKTPEKAPAETSMAETRKTPEFKMTKVPEVTEPLAGIGKMPILKKTEQEKKTGLKKRFVAKPENAGELAKNTFGDLAAAALLRPAGHTKVDQAIRWVAKQKDGLCLQSAYGVLRLCPVDSRILRVTFGRGNQLPEETHSNISVKKEFREWMYKDSYRQVELKTDEMYLLIDKGTGAVQFMTRDKKPLVSERAKESRLVEKTPQGQQVRLYLDWAKNENLFAMGAGTKADLSLKGVARYVNHRRATQKVLPMVYSDKGYGLVMASDTAVFCCNVSTYGTHLCVENTEVLDYYLIVGKNRGELLSIYEELCGKI